MGDVTVALCDLYEELLTMGFITIPVPDFCPAILYEIGDTGPAGGIVFYVTDGGLHGLEAETVILDPPTAPWGCRGIDITGADGTAIGTGAQNTADIIAGCMEMDSAARVADAYELNGFTDWFLPSQDELGQLYLQKNAVGAFSSSNYWSSSEIDGFFAWYQFFTDGTQANNDKIGASGVRAIRAF